jgi:peptide-methionine (S)-S-oxide reductase
MKHKYIKVLKYSILFAAVVSLVFGGSIVLTKNSLPKQKTIETNHAQTAIFSMGCFLSSEPVFINPNTNEKFPGILSIRVGHANGESEPKNIYRKSVKISFNPGIISYRQLLDIFWHNIDPFNEKGQFCNEGKEYTAAVLYSTDIQKEEALNSKKSAEALLNKKIITPILKIGDFHEAEEKYQNFFNKNPIRYAYYQWKCKREKPLKEIWGDISYMYQ